MANGTAMTTLPFYSSRVFWAILQDTTTTDQTGNHTVTVNGTVTNTDGPPDLYRGI